MTRRPGPARYTETEEFAAFVRRIVAAYRRRIAGVNGQAPDIDNLAGLAKLAADVDDAIGEAVTGLRAHGYTYQQIADVLGVSRQAVHQRYGKAAA